MKVVTKSLRRHGWNSFGLNHLSLNEGGHFLHRPFRLHRHHRLNHLSLNEGGHMMEANDDPVTALMKSQSPFTE